MVTADAEDEVERAVEAEAYVAEVVQAFEVHDLWDISGNVCDLASFSITEHIYT